MKFLIWIKKLWAKLFRRDPVFSEKDIDFMISQRLYKLAKAGRVKVYNGTLNGLKNAQANPNSDVYVMEVINPPKKEALIKFREYVNKLRQNIIVK